jgi:membrane protein
MKKWLEIVAGAFRRFNEDDGWAIASHIALSILTSLFPFLIFVTAIASMFGTKELADEAAHILLESWPEKVATPLAREIHNVLTQTRGGLLTVGIVLAIYFSTSAVEALRVALTRAYELREQRAWWLLRLESALYVLVGALGLLALAFLVVLAPLIWRAVVRFAPAVESLRDVVTLYRFGIAAALIALPLVIAHKYLPPGQRSWREIAPGVILHVLERAQARLLGVDEHGHVARRVLVFPHLGVRQRNLVPREHFRHARVDAAVDHELVGGGSLLQMREMRALNALLVHPHIARVEGQVEAGGAGAEHDHAAALHHEAGQREGRSPGCSNTMSTSFLPVMSQIALPKLARLLQSRR